MKEEKELPYSELTHAILGCCFEVMQELGPGFLEKIYKNALFIHCRAQVLRQIDFRASGTSVQLFDSVRSANWFTGELSSQKARVEKTAE